MPNLTGVLLVNLGTPDSPQPKDVYRYLTEFLTDERVVDYPWLWRQLLVRGLIIPLRYRQSSKLYQRLWTPKGSPLMVHGKEIESELQNILGDSFRVQLAMRYQNPSIENGINKLLKEPLDHLIILPLFPQYASATTGSIHQKVMEIIKTKQTIPKLTFISHFPDLPLMIEAFADNGRQYDLETFDHILFSYHGLPERQILKGDRFGVCGKEGCCKRQIPQNTYCYKAQCFKTTNAIAKELNLKESDYTITFQSRLGKEPWIKPYTIDAIHKLAEEGKKRLLVFCPAFVCDCLETTIEIGYEYGEEFHKLGGESLQLVNGLNNHPKWIEALKGLILKQVNFENQKN